MKRSRPPTRWPRVAALAIAVFFATACAGAAGATRGGPLGLSEGQAEWAQQIFGRAPDLVSVFRPYPGMDVREIYLGRGKARRSAIAFATLHCRQADLYFYGDVDAYLRRDGDRYDDGLEVLHGVPAWLDPVKRPDGEAEMALVGRSPAGVRSYRALAESAKHVRVFVLPSSTWIVTHGAVGQRVAEVLATDAAEPPTLDALPHIFVEQTRPVDVSRRRELQNLGWVPMLNPLDRLQAIGRVVYPLKRGRPPVIALKLVFTDADSARKAADQARTDPRLQRGGAKVHVERVGATVIIATEAS